jgi:hypothetical protein
MSGGEKKGGGGARGTCERCPFRPEALVSAWAWSVMRGRRRRRAPACPATARTARRCLRIRGRKTSRWGFRRERRGWSRREPAGENKADVMWLGLRAMCKCGGRGLGYSLNVDFVCKHEHALRVPHHAFARVQPGKRLVSEPHL